MKIVRKDATIQNTDDGAEGPGEFEVILSAPTKDRDGDTITSDQWKQPLPEHITFDIDHGMSVATVVGSGTPSIDDKGQLIVKGTYSSLPLAQDVRTLVNEGHIRTTSVAFMTEQLTEKGVKTITRELLNGAFVAVPSNREALVLSSKAFGRKSGARNSASDAEHIQAIHDHAVALGASADAKTDDNKKSVRFKSIVGSIEATQDRVRSAVQDAYPGAWCWIRATIPDGNGGGTVVYTVENRDTYDSEQFKQSYTDDGTVAALTGARSAVGVMEVLTPDPEEESEQSTDDGAAAVPAPAEKSAGAGTNAAPTPDAASEDRLRKKALSEHFARIAAAAGSPINPEGK